MVMSMDTASADQAMGSPMEDSALSIRHQESAEDELNMDEQSKASGQTIVDVMKNQHQQPQESSTSQKRQSTQQQQQEQEEKSQQQQKQHETEKQTESPAAMILSRESSFNDNDDEDERKLMMHVDYEAEASEQQLGPKEQIVIQSKFEDRSDLDRKDPLVARMRDIVEGNQTIVTQCQHHQHHHHHHQHQHHQPKSSSGDSLNNQANEGKISMDISQQKRSRQARHCGRHHHHHHHHRPSIGTNNSGGQTVTTGHHHHHHRPMGQQHAHRHHHHQHHLHDQQQQQQQQADPMGQPQISASAGSNKRSSNQRPSGGPDAASQQQTAELSLSQADISKQTGESKSSNSSVSSTMIDQQQQQQQHQQQQQQQQQHDAIISSKSNLEQVDLDPKVELEGGMHHAPSCHHHHHAHQSGAAQHPPHHHHHHHHHHGRHHHHHRNHKKRLVLDAGVDKSIEQVDNQSGAIATQGEKSDNNESTGFEQPEKQQESVSDLSPTDPMRRAPLQEISSQGINTTSDTMRSYCPYHEHHCAGHQSRGNSAKLHPHHHCHHHQHAEVQGHPKKEFPLSEQQSAQHRGHYHHHHHHRHHHHHGQHHSKPRTRRHKSSSKTNLDEQTQRKNSADIEPSMVDKQQEGGIGSSGNREEDNSISVDYNVCDRRSSSGSKKLGKPGGDQENRMLLDQNDESHHQEQRNQMSSFNKSNSEVVNMDISPNNVKKHAKMIGLADNEVEKLVDSPATNSSNFIAEIEISKQTKSNTNEQPSSNSNEKNDHQKPEDSDFNAQGASGNDATKQNSSHEFTRSQQGDSIKETSGKSDRLVGQISRDNSRKEMVSGSGSGDNRQQNQQQQLIECSPIQQYQQSSQPKQIIESTVSPDRRCRLCWCCCCPCSGLSTRNNPTKIEVKQNVSETPSATANRCQSISSNVPLDKIRIWAESFDRLMKCPDGRRIFQDFLRCEYSEENILFWIACEELKNEKDPKVIATKARDIYEDYISILSAKEVSLDSRVRDIINNNIKKPTSNIFDEAQLQIYTLMHRDSYPRFINSPMYKKLAQIQTSSSRKGST